MPTRLRLTLLACLLALPATLPAQTLMEQEQAAFQAAIDLVAPSVVQIQTFGGLNRVDDVLIGDGPTTGLIVSADGYVVTSAFAFAAKPSAAVVTLSDGRRLEAEIIATDSTRMLTLLKVEASDLPVFEPASVEPRVGQWTIAVGKVFDVKTPNASPGILSATDRIWGKAIQTDAKVSPFNYGGPLIDLHGRVMGVLVPLSLRGGGVMAGSKFYDSGIGFAVPIDQVRAAVEQLKAGDDLYPGTMGVLTTNPSNLFSEPRVARVAPGSPAAKAGMEKGDLITAIDSVAISRLSDLKRQLGPHYAGDSIAVTITRDDEQQTLELTLTKADKLKIVPQQHTIPQPGGPEEENERPAPK